MGNAELGDIFERHARIARDMSERGGVRNEGDYLRIKSFIKELSEFDGRTTIVDRYLIRTSLKTLREIVERCKNEYE